MTDVLSANIIVRMLHGVSDSSTSADLERKRWQVAPLLAYERRSLGGESLVFSISEPTSLVFLVQNLFLATATAALF